MDKIYDLDYFINKLEGIPEDKWTVGQYVDVNGCMCALGHCGMRDFYFINDNKEARALCSIRITRFTSISAINDDTENKHGFGTTPKQRVVNYLKSLRDR